MQSCNTTAIIKIKHARYDFFLVTIFVVAFMRNILLINIPVLIYLAISLCVVLLCNKEEIITYMCCLLPMMGIMQNRAALLLTSTGIVFKYKKGKIEKFLPLALMIIWETIHVGNSHINAYGFFQIFTPILVVSILVADSECFAKDGFLARSLALSTIICSLINLYACSIHNGYSILSLERFGNLNSEYEDFQGLINPNTNSFLCLMALCPLLLLKYYGEEKKGDLLFRILLIGIIMLTQSKATILCVVIVYIMYITLSKSFKKIQSKILIRSLWLLILVLILLVGFSDHINVIIQRFTAGDLSTGRTSINTFYLNHATSSWTNLIFGMGIYKYNDRIKDLYEGVWKTIPDLAAMSKGQIVYKPCHMGIVEIIVVWGLPGLVLTTLFFLEIFRKNKKAKSINYITIIIILIYSLQSQLIASWSIIHAIIIALYCIEYGMYKDMYVRL